MKEFEPIETKVLVEMLELKAAVLRSWSNDLCTGRRDWNMHIPPQRDVDPDCLIYDTLAIGIELGKRLISKETSE